MESPIHGHLRRIYELEQSLAEALADGLRANTALYSLDLSHNCLLGLDGMGGGEYDEGGVRALCTALDAHPSLRHVQLEGSRRWWRPPDL